MSKLIKRIAIGLIIVSIIPMNFEKVVFADSNYEEGLKNLDSNGYWYEESGSWYLMTELGQKATGWNYIDGQWYYLGSDGKMQTGWICDGGNWYYCWPNGAMAIDTIIDGYTVDSNGVWIK